MRAASPPGYTSGVSTEPPDRTAGCSTELARLLVEGRSRSREIERFYGRLRSRRVRDLDRHVREAHARAFGLVDCLC